MKSPLSKVTNMFIIILCSCLVASCGIFKKKTVDENIVENFDEFYNRFHKDESFQLTRLKFPLGGAMVDESGRKKWTKKNWGLMKVEIYDVDTKLYKTDYKKGKNTFYQKFWLENSGFSSEYRFELINNKWYLVYALDVSL